MKRPKWFPTPRRTIQWTITLGACAVAAANIYLPELEVDGVTVSLLVLAAIPWLAPLFRSIELPGGLKVEYQEELEAAEKKVEAAGLVAPAEPPTAEPERKTYSFEQVADDANLALAGLRIEVETRLRALAKSRDIPADKNVRRVTRDLFERGVLKKEEFSAIEELLPLLNQAAHGQVVDSGSAKWALRFGPRLLSALESRIGEPTVAGLMERWRNRDGAEFVEVGTALSKAVVETPREFLQAMHDDFESFSSWLGGISRHTFTMFESKNPLDDDLLEAYYLKLRDLMMDAVKPFENDPALGREAQSLVSELETIDVRSTA